MIKIDVTRLKEPKGFIKLVIIFLSLVAWATLVGSFPCGSAEGTYQDIAHGEFFTAIHVMVWLEQLIVLGLYLLAYDSLLACRINWFLLELAWSMIFSLLSLISSSLLANEIDREANDITEEEEQDGFSCNFGPWKFAVAMGFMTTFALTASLWYIFKEWRDSGFALHSSAQVAPPLQESGSRVVSRRTPNYSNSPELDVSV